MLKKLRIKFVAIIMTSVAVVLAVVFSGICIAEYQRSLTDMQTALNASLDRAVNGMRGEREQFMSGGVFFEGLEFGGEPSLVNSDDSAGKNTKQQRDRFNEGMRIGGKDGEGRSLVPIAVYSLDGGGNLVSVSGFTTATMDDDVLESVSVLIAEADDGYGELLQYGLLYQKRTVEAMTYAAFADAANMSSWQSLALMLVVAAIVVLAVFFVIALLISKWALRPVEEAWNSQRQFVADASHELKTPLTVILANTSILLKHPEQSIAAQSQWVESTQVEAESMQGLVNEMLELAQVESRANIHHEPLDFSELVDLQTLQFESVAFERGCLFEESIAQGVTVDGDAQRLTKMTSTLIENALKYVEKGGTVEVKLTEGSGMATLSIRNTGAVIAQEDLPHIFDRFYRTDKARTSGTGGYGLGLAIAREIAREHDGDIICASTPESGTTFTVTLPTV